MNQKKITTIFVCLLSLLFISCSSDDIINIEQEEFSNQKAKKAEVTFIKNEPIVIRSYKLKNYKTGKYNYLETTALPMNVNYVELFGVRYQICKNRNSEANIGIFQVFNSTIGDAAIMKEGDVLKPGYYKSNFLGYIYSGYKLGLVPLKEYFSAKNQDTRYFVHNSEIFEMYNKGEDYKYVRTLGYVCPSQYSAPSVELSYISKSSNTYKLYFWQTVYGNRHHTDDMMIYNSWDGKANKSTHLIGDRYIEFSFVNFKNNTKKIIYEYVPSGKKVYIYITKSDEIELIVN